MDDIHNESATRVKGEISNLFKTIVASYGLVIAGALVGIGTTYFSTRVFLPEVYGQLTMISMAAGIIQAFGFTWLGSALIRFGKEEYIETGGVRQTFQVRFLILSPIWIAAILIYAAAYFLTYDYLSKWIGLSGWILWTIPILFTLSLLSSELVGYLNVFGKYTNLAGADLSGQFVRLVVVALLYLQFGAAGIGWLIVLAVLGWTGQTLYLTTWLERRNFRVGRMTALQDPLRRTVRYSMPILGTSIIGFIYNPIEIFVIRYFFSIRGVGLFSTANAMSKIFSSFVMLFPGLTFPILQGLRANGNHEGMRRFYQRLVPQLTILFAASISLCIILMPPMIKLLLNERYHPAIATFLVFVYAEIPHLTTALQSSYSYIYDKTGQPFRVMVFQYVLELACYFFLIPRIGIEGAAWGWVGAYLASTFLLTYYVSQEFGPCKQSYFASGLSVLLGMGALLLTRSEVPFGIQLFAITAMMIATGLLTKAFKLFDRGDAELLMMIGIPQFLQRPLRMTYQVLG